jgi:hypothetical protein
MSVITELPRAEQTPKDCTGCGGAKGAPLASVVHVFRDHEDAGVLMVLCEECGRDLANAVGFMCIKDGGWSKLEPRKRKAAR